LFNDAILSELFTYTVPNGRMMVADEEKEKCKEMYVVYCITTNPVKGTAHNKLTDQALLSEHVSNSRQPN
jgi:hypothetical protein